MSEDKITVITNNHPRCLRAWIELSEKHRKELDYFDESKEDEFSFRFFVYKGQVYDVNEFSYTGGLPEFNPLRKWDGYISDSFFSGVLVKWTDVENDVVTVGRFFA